MRWMRHSKGILWLSRCSSQTAKSSTMIDTSAATQTGTPTRLNRPMPWLSAHSAAPTAAAGNTMRKATEDSTSMPTLVSQRRVLSAASISGRSSRGWASSMIASVPKINRNAPKRITGSGRNRPLSGIEVLVVGGRGAEGRDQAVIRGGLAGCRLAGAQQGNGLGQLIDIGSASAAHQQMQLEPGALAQAHLAFKIIGRSGIELAATEHGGLLGAGQSAAGLRL